MPDVQEKNREPEAGVRPYRGNDRGAVRRISYDTADAGNPGNTICRDRRFVEDALTSYYTDWENESILIAEVDGKAVGYLMGCLDTRRQLRVTLKVILPRAVLGAVLRGALAHADSYRLAWRAVRIFLSSGAHRGVDLERYPAHFHLNIAAGYRRAGLGPRLVDAFEARARAAGTSGIHLAVREDNAAARRFFEKRGYVQIGREAAPLAPGGNPGASRSIVYGKQLV